jgi:hypothetical protein
VGGFDVKRTIGIEFEGAKGTIEWDDEGLLDDFVVDFEDNIEKEEEVIDYLLTKKAFQIPESDEIDDFRTDYAYPTDHPVYFDLTLMELSARTGVKVDWREYPGVQPKP